MKAENPATWGEAEKIIQAAIVEHDRLVYENPDLCGLSMARRIADALREAKLLRECTCSPDQKWHSMMCPTSATRMDEPAG